MGMDILLLGGTGAMGVYLTKLLNCDERVGHVYVTSRKRIDAFGKVEYILGNAKDNDFLNKLINSKYDAIVDFMSYGTHEFSERVDCLLESTKHYIFLSSSRVYADSGEKRIVESSPRLLDVCKDESYLKSDEYALSKARQENILRSKEKKNWTIIRPYITYSEERLQLGIYEKEQWLYRAINGKPIVFSREIGNNLTTLTWGGDVARYIGELLKTEPSGDTYHITGEYVIKWNDILRIYLDTIEDLTGLRPQVCYVDPPYVPISQKYQYLVDRRLNRVFDNSKLKKVLNQELSFESPDRIADCVRGFITQGRPFRTINWVCEAEMDRLTHSMQKLCDIKDLKDKSRYIGYRYAPFIFNTMR